MLLSTLFPWFRCTALPVSSPMAVRVWLLPIAVLSTGLFLWNSKAGQEAKFSTSRTASTLSPRLSLPMIPDSSLIRVSSFMAQRPSAAFSASSPGVILFGAMRIAGNLGNVADLSPTGCWKFAFGVGRLRTPVRGSERGRMGVSVFCGGGVVILTVSLRNIRQLSSMDWQLRVCLRLIRCIVTISPTNDP